MEYKETLVKSSAIADKLELACQQGLPDCGKDEAIFDEEVRFPNGNRVAIQVIASNDPGESAWTQGVLFAANGEELGCTDVGESFLGEYRIPDGDDEYVVIVAKE